MNSPYRFLVLSLLVVGCAPTGPAASPLQTIPASLDAAATHLTAEEAIELARGHVTMTRVIDATNGPYADLRAIPADRSISAERLVWAVRFTGDIEICPPPPGPCRSPRPATSTVFLDYATGAFLSTSTVSPG